MQDCVVSGEEKRVMKLQGKDIEKVELPKFYKRQLSTFEGVFLTEEQVQRCEEMYLNKVKSSNPLYLSWKALK